MTKRTQRSVFARRTGRLFFRKIVGPMLRTPQLARRTQFEVRGAVRQHVVMMGDSITEFGNWNEWFPETPIVNRGIAGETSSQVLARLDSAIDQPLAVFLLIGTNDLSFGIPRSEIAQNVQSIVAEVERMAPGTPVVVQSVMPRALAFHDEVSQLNQQYRELVEAAPDHVRYLDLWPALASPEGALRADFSQDKLHLNGSGYRAWVDALQPVMAEVVGRT